MFFNNVEVCLIRIMGGATLGVPTFILLALNGFTVGHQLGCMNIGLIEKLSIQYPMAFSKSLPSS
nr:stage II sporulation protein M [Archaeoglobus fulgidus]